MGINDSLQHIVVEKLLNDGYTESSKKPGLFYKKDGVVRLFVDLRGSKTDFYGFTEGDNQRIENEDADKYFKKLRRELAAVGVERLDRFVSIENKTASCPSCEGWLEGKNIEQWNHCPYCGIELRGYVDEHFY